VADLGISLEWMRWRDLGVPPESRFVTTLVVCLIACTLLYGLASVHRARLRRIPIRIHVAGTRGKSSAVRLIAAGLRAGGHRVVAKVTGTQPRLVLPDADEQPIRRWGQPAIREQTSFLAHAIKAGADAIVAEAMAIQPEHLSVLERFYIRATDLVITNVRPDHREHLGLASDAMADAISECIPAGGRLFLTREAAVGPIVERASQRHCEVSIVDSDPDSDPEDANWRLALAVCRAYGVSTEDAERAMRLASRDIGQFTISRLLMDGRPIDFANAFSCNDVESFSRLWMRHQPPGRSAAFVLNPRADRPVRTVEFLKCLARLAPDAQLFISSRNPALRRRAVAHGFVPDRVHLVTPRMTENGVRSMISRVRDGAVVWGVGNYRGAGAKLTMLVRGLSTSC